MRAETLQSLFDAALADDERTEDILRQRTSISEETLADRRIKEIFISPQQAIECGLCNAVRDFALPTGERNCSNLV